MGRGSSRSAVRVSILLLFVFLFSFQLISPMNANFLDNSIEKTPPFSKKLSIFLIDLSGSVDHEVVIKGFETIRGNLAYVYDGSDVERKVPADSYFRWIPIRGAEADSGDLPIFTEEDDQAIWAAARRIKGKANQLQVIKTIRETNGLWSRLMSEKSLDVERCEKISFRALQSPGLSGRAFQRLNTDICDTALSVRARVKQIIDNIKAFTEPKAVTSPEGKTSFTTDRNTTGTDIFGTINKLERVSRNSTYLNQFKEVKLVFISDMLHNTDNINLRKELAGKKVPEGCELANKQSELASGFNPTKFRVTIYGLGEVKRKRRHQQQRVKNFILCLEVFGIASGEQKA